MFSHFHARAYHQPIEYVEKLQVEEPVDDIVVDCGQNATGCSHQNEQDCRLFANVIHKTFHQDLDEFLCCYCRNLLFVDHIRQTSQGLRCLVLDLQIILPLVSLRDMHQLVL